MGLRASLACALSLLCACAGGEAALPSAEGGAPDDEDAPHLRIAFSRIEAEDIALLREHAARFADEHPGVEVEVVAQAWRSTDVHDLWARFLALGDPSIDVYVIDDPWVAEFAYAGWIAPLDELEGWAHEVMPEGWLESGTFRGHLYAVPYEVSANALFYRRDWLEEAELEPPRTLRELASIAQRLREERALRAGLVLHVQFAHNDVYPFFWASGGGALGADGRSALDAAPNRAAIETLLTPGLLLPREELATLAQPPHGYHEAITPFERGEAAFMINWLRYDVGDLADRVGIAPIPGTREGAGGSTLGSWHWAVSAHSRHQALARELVRALSSERACEERLERLGTLPPLARFYEDRERIERFPLLERARPVLDVARPRMPVPDEHEADAIVERTLRAILLEGAPVVGALAQGQEELRAEIEAFPPEPLVLPEPPAQPHTQASDRAELIVVAVGVQWGVAIGFLALGLMLERRRGGLFRRLATKVAILGLWTLLLALGTGTAVALAMLVQNQDEAIADAQDIFRASIREHSLSLGRQIALGASVVREVTTVAHDVVVETAQRDAAARGEVDAWQRRDEIEASHAEMLGGIEGAYRESLRVLAAQGSYTDDIVFLQIVSADGEVVVDEDDFLGQESAAPAPLERTCAGSRASGVCSPCATCPRRTGSPRTSR